MKKLLGLIAALCLLSAPARAAESMQKLTDRVFRLAVQQYAAMARELPEGASPKTLDSNGTLETSDVLWWCSGFYPGTLWYIYEYTGDESIKALAEEKTLAQAPLLGLPTHHDIGFQINSCYGNALRLTGDKEKYQAALLAAADKLAERFNPKVACIKSWDNPRWKYPVIIDNMMNLELLLNAWKINGKKELFDVAVKHANTTMLQHFRPDYSTYHLVDYDPETGKVISRETNQGKADDSMWARGEAWAFYGYVMMYRKTGDELYLKQAEYIAGLLIRSLPEDGIPYWDFSCPGEYRDASAAAIMASAFAQIYEVTGRKDCLEMAEKILRKLSGKDYLAKAGTNGHFLLKHCVGNMPKGTEIDVPLSYADYYYLEALLVYRRATSHGKLLIDDRTYSSIRSQLESGSNPTLSRAHSLFMNYAESLPQINLSYSFDASGMRLAPAPREVYNRMMSWSYAYRFTRERKYLELVENLAAQICSFPDWNAYHFLDVAGICAGIAVAYDWLYDELRPATRQMLRDAVYKNAFLEAHNLNKAWFYEKTHNWNQVCNASLVMVATAMMGDFGTLAGNFIPNAVRTNRKAMKESYAPNGCYPEGPSYWAYGNQYQVLLNMALDSAIDDDMGLSGLEGFSESGDYVFFCSGVGGRMFNYYDNGEAEKPCQPLWYFASRFNKPYLLSRELKFLQDDSYAAQNQTFMPCVISIASRMPVTQAPVPETHTYVGKGATPIVVYRGDWSGSETDVYLGIKGGKAITNHGHMDSGSFVFDRFGVRWASDPGNVKYSDIENIIKARGGNYWEKEQNSLRWDVYPMNNYWHNTLTVNGDHHEVAGNASVRQVIDSCGLHGAVLDLQELFIGTESATRKIVYDEKDGSLTITDCIAAGEEDAAVRFSWITYIQVNVSDTSAELSSNGHSLTLSSTGADAKYSLRTYDEPLTKDERIIDIDWKVPAGKTLTLTTTLK